MSQFFSIIVHYGPSSPTREAIKHLLAGSVQPKCIVVVDHARTPFEHDPSDRIRVIRPINNGGYAAGLNTGLGALSTLGATFNDVVIAMNNDIYVQPDTLAAIQFWHHTHGAKALAGVVVQEGGALIFGGGRVHTWTGRAMLNTSPQQKLDYVHGAFLVAPYEIFLKTQGLPEHFFLYWEDVAFSYLLRRQHIPLTVIPTARVTHKTTSNTMTDTHLYYLVRNGAIFLEQYLAWPWRQYWRLGNYARRLYHAATRRNNAAGVTIRQALYDAQRRRAGVRPSIASSAHAT